MSLACRIRSAIPKGEARVGREIRADLLPRWRSSPKKPKKKRMTRMAHATDIDDDQASTKSEYAFSGDTVPSEPTPMASSGPTPVFAASPTPSSGSGSNSGVDLLCQRPSRLTQVRIKVLPLISLAPPLHHPSHPLWLWPSLLSLLEKTRPLFAARRVPKRKRRRLNVENLISSWSPKLL